MRCLSLVLIAGCTEPTTSPPIPCLDVGQTSDPTHRIAVPDATWKIVVFVEAGVALRDAVDPYVVGVMMPNEQGIEDTRWWDYRATVSQIEQASGYDVPVLE